jgi:hypothetical protein
MIVELDNEFVDISSSPFADDSAAIENRFMGLIVNEVEFL